MSLGRSTRRPLRPGWRTRAAAGTLALLLLLPTNSLGGPYVTQTSGIRWNDVGGIRWNDVGGIRWNDVGGIRWNDVGGIRWNDVGGIVFSDALGIRWNDVGGIRWNDVGGITFDPVPGSGVSIDLDLLDILSFLPDTSSIDVVITYGSGPSQGDFNALAGVGILGGEIFRRLPMVVVNATKQQIHQISTLPNVRSVYSNKTLSFLDEESAALIGAPEVAADPGLVRPGGGPLSGAGVTIAVLDTGVDGTHPDLPYGTKVVQNVRLNEAMSAALPGFFYPTPAEGFANTDLVLGHGTFVASVAAGTGAASGGQYAGIAPGASILGLSAGDLVIVNVLEGFDYILDNAARFGVRVVNCSWGTEGWFDPDDPVNIATRMLYDAGITVIFAAGNNGPAPDTLNPYSVAPWVIGVGSTRKDGRLSDFSSRGIYEELLYHPMLVAPGEDITAARAGLPGGPPELYTVESGTSFAAPHVAGAVALILEANPQLGPGAVRRILQQTATPILSRDRSQVGAGRLDAWAAVAQALYPSRPFGTHIPGWLDERPYRIDHHPGIEDSYTLPAGGTLSIPAAIDPGATSWQLQLAWGTLPGTGDLDVRLVDASGAEVARSDSLNGLGLFGREEGVHLLGNVPPEMTVEVRFKDGTGELDQSFYLRQETSVAALTAYQDLGSLNPSDLDVVTRAVSRNLITGRGTGFEPFAPLRRGELARSLALAAGMPQRVPAAASFGDVPPSHPQSPYIETVAGARARGVLMDPVLLSSSSVEGPTGVRLRRVMTGSATHRPAPRLVPTGSSPPVTGFAPDAAARRLDFAVAMVRAAGKRQEAETRASEPLALADSGKIPAVLKGYVAVALENGLIATVPRGGETFFDPDDTVSRLEASRRLLRLLELLE